MNDSSGTASSGSPIHLPKVRGERIRLAPHVDIPNSHDGSLVGAWLASRPRPWAVDLFSGAGGLSLGIEEAGFSAVAAADYYSDSIETHTHNIPCLTWTGDLADLLRRPSPRPMTWPAGKDSLPMSPPACAKTCSTPSPLRERASRPLSRNHWRIG